MNFNFEKAKDGAKKAIIGAEIIAASAGAIEAQEQNKTELNKPQTIEVSSETKEKNIENKTILFEDVQKSLEEKKSNKEKEQKRITVIRGDLGLSPAIEIAAQNAINAAKLQIDKSNPIDEIKNETNVVNPQTEEGQRLELYRYDFINKMEEPIRRKEFRREISTEEKEKLNDTLQKRIACINSIDLISLKDPNNEKPHYGVNPETTAHTIWANSQEYVFDILAKIDNEYSEMLKNPLYQKYQIFSDKIFEMKSGLDDGRNEDTMMATVGEDKPIPVAGYMRNIQIGNIVLQEILNASKERDVDPYVLAATIAIETSGTGKISTRGSGNYFQLGNYIMAKYKVPRYPYSLNSIARGSPVKDIEEFNYAMEQLAKEAHIWQGPGIWDKKALLKKLDQWIALQEMVNKEMASYKNNADAYAVFLKMNGLKAFNSGQKPGVKTESGIVKNDFPTMINAGANYLRSRDAFNMAKKQFESKIATQMKVSDKLISNK